MQLNLEREVHFSQGSGRGRIFFYVQYFAILLGEIPLFFGFEREMCNHFRGMCYPFSYDGRLLQELGGGFRCFN